MTRPTPTHARFIHMLTLLAIAAALAATGCEAPLEDPAEAFIVEPGFLDFRDTLTELVVTLEANSSLTQDWTARFDPPVAWAALSDSAGYDDGSFTVTVDREGLDYGEYVTQLVVEYTDGVTDGAKYATVIMFVLPPEPEPRLAVSPENIGFPAGTRQRILRVENAGGGSLEWQLTVRGAPWLKLDRFMGSNDRDVTLTVDRSGLAPGDYEGTITVTSTAGTAEVGVFLAVRETIVNGTIRIDTPIPGTDTETPLKAEGRNGPRQ